MMALPVVILKSSETIVLDSLKRISYQVTKYLTELKVESSSSTHYLFL